MIASLGFIESMLEHLNIGLVVVDNENRIVLFNRLAGEMLEQDPHQRIGSSVLSCHPRESDPIVSKLINDIKIRVLDHYEGWVNFRGRMLYEYIVPIWDTNGNYLGMIEELHEAREKVDLLKRLGEFKDVHVSGVGKRQPRNPELI